MLLQLRRLTIIYNYTNLEIASGPPEEIMKNPLIVSQKSIIIFK